MKHTLYTLIPAFLALLALSMPVWADSFGGKVVSVTDGDTIQVMRDGKAEKVRLHGVDTPESNQDFGTKAKQFTSSMVFGNYVTVDVVDTDRYGRLVGVVIAPDGSNLNQELVRNGMAWWYRQYAAGDTTLQQLEANAKASHVGLWSMPNPVAPWDFRRGKTGPTTSPTSPSPTGIREAANPSTGPPSTSDTATGEVYITASGKKYHSDGCRYLSKSKIPSTLADATAQGYGPCSVCNPSGGTAAVAPTTPTYQIAPKTGPPATDAAAEVYITNTGAKYHSAGCRYLSKSQIPISLDEAKVSYGPCSVCGPPR